MIDKRSRYAMARAFEVRDGEPFPGVQAREIGPASGVVEHIVKAGDRLDLLARHYYSDDRLWWRIVDANPRILYGGHVLRAEMEGAIILIPRARE